MNIQLINPFTNNLLSLAKDGLMENYAITSKEEKYYSLPCFPFWEVLYHIIFSSNK